MHPWDDVVPPSDIDAFAGGAGTIDRPLEAGSRPALIVVDMTRAFVEDAYPTGWGRTGGPATSANSELLECARTAGIPVYFTKAYPGADYQPSASERGRWKSSMTVAARSDLPPGDVIVEALTPRAGETVIHKGHKPSAFFGTPLASLLIGDGVDTTIVTGMTTSGCVRATAVDAFQFNFHVVVPHEACADRSLVSHKVTLFDLHMKYADVVSVADAQAYVTSVG